MAYAFVAKTHLQGPLHFHSASLRSPLHMCFAPQCFGHSSALLYVLWPHAFIHFVHSSMCPHHPQLIVCQRLRGLRCTHAFAVAFQAPALGLGQLRPRWRRCAHSASLRSLCWLPGTKTKSVTFVFASCGHSHEKPPRLVHFSRAFRSYSASLHSYFTHSLNAPYSRKLYTM